MRVSAIADWTTCEAMAVSDPHPEARVHVAAWVGTLAHAYLLEDRGHLDGTKLGYSVKELYQLPEEPVRLRYDAITPTAHAVEVQAHALASEALRCLDLAGWTIMEAEREVKGEGVTGHLDILAWHGETKRTAIIDLKTGRDIGAGWLQVGGYLELLGRMAIDAGWQHEGAYLVLPGDISARADTRAEYGGILHVPRVSISKEPKATLEVRYAVDLMNAWTTAKSRIDAVLAGATALRSPGQHCGRCTARCPVRV